MIIEKEIAGIAVAAHPTPKALQNTTIGSTRVPSVRLDAVSVKTDHIARVCDVLERALDNVYRNHPEKRAAVAAEWDAAIQSASKSLNTAKSAEPNLNGGS